jgi:RNA polymerase sigma-70 factor, ECF subfamily
MVTAGVSPADARPHALDGEVDIDRDRLLVERAQAGDNTAFDSLYSFYAARLERYCLQRLRDPHEAQDVAQETFLRAWRALPNFGGDRRFYPWLSVIASNLCTDALRRRQRFGPIPVAEPEERNMGFVRSTEDSVVASADIDLATEALSHLSARHRRVLELRERSGLTYQQIADKEGLRITTVETLIWRARQAFKREFLELTGSEGAMVGILGAGALARALRRFVRMPKAMGAKFVALGPSGIAAGVGGAVATGAIVVASVAGGHAATNAALQNAQSNSQIGTSLHMGSSGSVSASAAATNRAATGKTSAGSAGRASSGSASSGPASTGPTSTGAGATASLPGAATTVVPGSGSVPTGAISKIVGSTPTTLAGAAGDIVQSANQTVTDVTGAVGSVVSGVNNVLGNTLDDAGNAATQVVDGVTKTAGTVLSGVGNTIGKTVSGAVSAASNPEGAVADAKDAAGQAASDVAQAASQATSGLKNTVNGVLPSTTPSDPSSPVSSGSHGTTSTTEGSGLIKSLLGG